MYKMAKGTKTARLITSWRILSCGRESAVYPIRLAGTWSRYSKSAIDQLTTAAMYHARWLRFRRCAYHAKVMKTLDRTRSPTVFVTTDIRCSARVEREIHAVSRKRYWTRSGSEAGGRSGPIRRRVAPIARPAPRTPTRVGHGNEAESGDDARSATRVARILRGEPRLPESRAAG